MEAAAAAAHGGGSGGRILLLTGGPATAGPGQVVPQDLGESIRTHKASVWGSRSELGKGLSSEDAIDGGARQVMLRGRVYPHAQGEECQKSQH